MKSKLSQEQLNHILDFLKEFPEMMSWRGKNKPDINNKPDVERIKNKIIEFSQKKIEPSVPKTIPDPQVSEILIHYYGVKRKKTEKIKKEHQFSMAAENIIGELLEEYIFANSKGKLIRCYGDIIKGTDFLKKDSTGWTLIQIKNRDNSENSSSSSIRDTLKEKHGVTIIKWYRTKALTGKTQWQNFPDPALKKILSEQGFTDYIEGYLTDLKNSEG